jgi:Family of unknown function (DUF5302)
MPTEEQPVRAEDAAEDDPEDAAERGAEDEVRRKFREALERKQHQHAAGTAAGDGKDPSRVHEAHGLAASRRSFRRKSG